MIEIVPNILVKTQQGFKVQLLNLKSINKMDIDICSKPFMAEDTLDLIIVLNSLKGEQRSLGFHLMQWDPRESVKMILKSKLHIEVIYLHQESDLSYLKELSKSEMKLIGISIKIETKLLGIEFYNKFRHIQLMTGTFGGQGKVFSEESLAKSIELRKMGFSGSICADGGVNLKSAKIIKEYPIDRVSVGSYFVNSENVVLDHMKLDLAMNIKIP